jgi:medium-chain acyl-[acyl-carrier-protein] hydrolase
MFNAWAGLLPEFELYLVHLPGRDKRIKETLPKQLHPLVEALTEAIIPYLDKPFAFFGHSMGSLVSFEVARQLRRRHASQPMHLFVSGRHSPHIADAHPNLYQLPENEFLQATENLYGALPEVIRRDHEVLKLFLSIMRADLTMLGTYQYIHEPPLDCPISVFGGLQDRSITEAELGTWSEQTASSFNLKMLPGDHFFIQSSRTILLQDLKLTLSQYLRN